MSSDSSSWALLLNYLLLAKMGALLNSLIFGLSAPTVNLLVIGFWVEPYNFLLGLNVLVTMLLLEITCIFSSYWWLMFLVLSMTWYLIMNLWTGALSTIRENGCSYYECLTVSYLKVRWICVELSIAKGFMNKTKIYIYFNRYEKPE